MKDESKSNRILCLYDELRAGKSINKAAWAKAHGVCERSVRRDLDTIQHYLCEKSRDDLGDMTLIRRQGKGKYGITNLDSRSLMKENFWQLPRFLQKARRSIRKNFVHCWNVCFFPSPLGRTKNGSQAA